MNGRLPNQRSAENQPQEDALSYKPPDEAELSSDPHQLQGFKYFKMLGPLLKRLHGRGAERDKAGNRTFHYNHYATLILFYFFNPALVSLRAIQKAGTLKQVQQKLGIPRMSLGSLSEACSVFDAEVQLGGKKAKGVLTQNYRVVQIQYGTGAAGEPLIMTLVTDRLDLKAELIALAYHYRWQIELFFRWLNCVLGCRHLLHLDRNGVHLQVYLASIASLLISLWVGCKPMRRTYEMLCFYFMGLADLDELTEHLEELRAKQQGDGSKSSS